MGYLHTRITGTMLVDQIGGISRIFHGSSAVLWRLGESLRGCLICTGMSVGRMCWQVGILGCLNKWHC